MALLFGLERTPYGFEAMYQASSRMLTGPGHYQYVKEDTKSKAKLRCLLVSSVSQVWNRNSGEQDSTSEVCSLFAGIVAFSMKLLCMVNVMFLAAAALVWLISYVWSRLQTASEPLYS